MKRKEIEKFLKRICAKNAQKEINTWQKLLHRKLNDLERYMIQHDWMNDDLHHHVTET